MEIFTTFGRSGYALDALQLFHGIPQDSIAPLLASCAVARVEAGQPVADTDEPACLYILLRGALEVLHPDARTGPAEHAAVRVLPGECVGELAVLDEDAGTDQVRALQESDVLVIGAPTLWRLIDESNGVARNLLRLLSFRVRAANAQLRRRRKLGEFYRQLSMADGLTGLHNRAWLHEHLPALVGDAHLAQRPLSLIMIDIDHFKRFNDEHGHLCGDNALQAAAGAISGALRPTDFAARYGGEELLVILPSAARDAAVAIAGRLREQLHQVVVFNDMHVPLPHVTASFGVAALAAGQDADALLAAADAALYRAKEAGRDRVAY